MNTTGIIGIRNNNWTNIKCGNTPWHGQIGKDDQGHAIFCDPVYGLRAEIYQIEKWFHARNMTVREIVEKQTDVEGDWPGYIKKIIERSHYLISADQPMNLFDDEKRITQKPLLETILAGMIEAEICDDFEAGDMIGNAIALYTYHRENG